MSRVRKFTLFFGLMMTFVLVAGLAKTVLAATSCHFWTGSFADCTIWYGNAGDLNKNSILVNHGGEFMMGAASATKGTLDFYTDNDPFPGRTIGKSAPMIHVTGCDIDDPAQTDNPYRLAVDPWLDYESASQGSLQDRGRVIWQIPDKFEHDWSENYMRITQNMLIREEGAHIQYQIVNYGDQTCNYTFQVRMDVKAGNLVYSPDYITVGGTELTTEQQYTGANVPAWFRIADNDSFTGNLVMQGQTTPMAHTMYVVNRPWYDDAHNSWFDNFQGDALSDNVEVIYKWDGTLGANQSANYAIQYERTSDPTLFPELEAVSLDASQFDVHQQMLGIEEGSSLTAQIKNSGNADVAAGTYSIAFYEERDGTAGVGPSDRVFGFVSGPALAAGASTPVTLDFTPELIELMGDGAMVQFYGNKVHAMVDATNTIAEQNENDNITSAWPLGSCAGTPNLTISHLDIRSEPGNGTEKYFLTALVGNASNTAVPASQIFFAAFYNGNPLDGDPATGGSLLENRVRIRDGIGAGDFRMIELELTPSYHGFYTTTHNVHAAVDMAGLDTGDRVTECHEDDNIFDSENALRVPGPVFYGVDARNDQLIKYNYMLDGISEKEIIGTILDENDNAVDGLLALASYPYDQEDPDAPDLKNTLYGVSSITENGDRVTKLWRIDTETARATLQGQIEVAASEHYGAYTPGLIEGLTLVDDNPDPDAESWWLYAAVIREQSNSRQHLIKFRPVGNAGVVEATEITRYGRYRGLTSAPDGTLYGVWGNTLDRIFPIADGAPAGAAMQVVDSIGLATGQGLAFVHDDYRLVLYSMGILNGNPAHDDPILAEIKQGLLFVIGNNETWIINPTNYEVLGRADSIQPGGLRAIAMVHQTYNPDTFVGPMDPDPEACCYTREEVSPDSRSWISATNVLNISNQNNATTDVGLPFAFTFQEQVFNTVHVSTNGNIHFQPGGADKNYQAPADPALPNAVIAPLWMDLYPNREGEVLTHVAGTAPDRTFVVEWRNVRRQHGRGTVTFQVQLQESTNEIWFLYQDTDFQNIRSFGSDAFIGLEGIDGLDAHPYNYKKPGVVADDDPDVDVVLRFIPMEKCVELPEPPVCKDGYCFRDNLTSPDFYQAWKAEGQPLPITHRSRGVEVTFPAGYTFNFGGQQHTSVYVSNYGALSFDHYNPSRIKTMGWPDNLPNELIAVHWSPLDETTGEVRANIMEQPNGEAWLVVTWNNKEHRTIDPGDGNGVTFQAQLQLTQNNQPSGWFMLYKDLEFVGDGNRKDYGFFASIGWEHTDATLFHSYSDWREQNLSIPDVPGQQNLLVVQYYPN